MRSCHEKRWWESAETRGFTLLEMIVVLLVIAVTLAIASQTYGFYLRRNAGRRAAEIFASDLSLARTLALRDRQPAALVLESAQRYVIRTLSGDVIAVRDYASPSDLRLSAVRLDLPGDSIAFTSRGLLDLGGAPGTLGTAWFDTGPSSYQVRFNSMGASEIHGP